MFIACLKMRKNEEKKTYLLARIGEQDGQISLLQVIVVDSFLIKYFLSSVLNSFLSLRKAREGLS